MSDGDGQARTIPTLVVPIFDTIGTENIEFRSYKDTMVSSVDFHPREPARPRP